MLCIIISDRFMKNIYFFSELAHVMRGFLLLGDNKFLGKHTCDITLLNLAKKTYFRGMIVLSLLPVKPVQNEILRLL